MKQSVRTNNRRMLGKLALIIVLMFGFGYALVPLYQVFCEITGINVLTKVDEDAVRFARNTQVDTSRTVKIVFDSNIQGPWRFRPVQSSMEVNPGELATIVYEIANQQDRQMAGQAIPSYAPLVAGQYFKKLECFCFSQQDLKARETRQFPVVFVVDPKLPKEVQTITLSYTFFEVGARAAAAPSPGEGA
ncbi:Cytochrome c oxidase assembly protein CtaG [Pigmentiphaga humi]|uniref:Cytochrome c oxidase assembly protein CtaG n=1 Tax=Pigmentiphaga humi TaxID=2478468 RepID=A0A3P4B2N4_9BURK|nr:cytochrome c oxidase assembly protein [Pigmentiphaga humi]VCU70549.1 Cytochrome c oxidase assembly protein CtaG [Pigmentiphaga humi]